jgi:hypothetical protein
MAEETPTMVQERFQICDHRVAGANSETPLEREAAVLCLVKAGDDALVEKRAREFTKKLWTMDRRSKVRRGSP